MNDFDAFYNYMGECPVGHSLDRIDCNLNYEEGNLQWADRCKQNQNSRRRKTSENKYKYVSQTKESNSYRSRFDLNGSQYYLGQFKTDTQAAIAAYLRYKELTGDWPKYIEDDLTELGLVKGNIYE